LDMTQVREDRTLAVRQPRINCVPIVYRLPPHGDSELWSELGIIIEPVKPELITRRYWFYSCLSQMAAGCVVRSRVGL